VRFSAFVDKKTSKARRELEVVRDILKEGGVKVEDFLKEESPYLFVPSSNNGLNFGGIRVYKVGNSVAYRIQNEGKTEPYGKSYSLDIRGVFEDLVSDMDADKAAEETKKAVVEEITKFFEKSAEAQEELESPEFDPHNKVMVVPGKSTDLSNMF
jgi:hypothetical protein